jgi:hypothetical protein
MLMRTMMRMTMETMEVTIGVVVMTMAAMMKMRMLERRMIERMMEMRMMETMVTLVALRRFAVVPLVPSHHPFQLGTTISPTKERQLPASATLPPLGDVTSLWTRHPVLLKLRLRSPAPFPILPPPLSAVVPLHLLRFLLTDPQCVGLRLLSRLLGVVIKVIRQRPLLPPQPSVVVLFLLKRWMRMMMTSSLALLLRRHPLVARVRPPRRLLPRKLRLSTRVAVDPRSDLS